MGFKEQYERIKVRLLADMMICEANRDLFREFFEFEEYKLKRQNGLSELDEGCYKTLCGYVKRFRNVNAWFANKPWKELTREDIKRVYDALEDGTIRNQRGQPFGDPVGYYNKVFKSKPFRLAGKAELARDVIEFSVVRPRDVRFITEETFRTLVSIVAKPRHLLLLWLAWDRRADTCVPTVKSESADDISFEDIYGPLLHFRKAVHGFFSLHLHFHTYSAEDLHRSLGLTVEDMAGLESKAEPFETRPILAVGVADQRGGPLFASWF